MRLLELIARVRTLTRDFTNSIFREQDIVDFINEGINRIKQIIPEMSGLKKLIGKEEVPLVLPEEYHHLLSVYAASRCFGQDERHYQATTLMNEFEIKLDKLKENIENGVIVITDPNTGDDIMSNSNNVEYVDLESYWGRSRRGF